MTANADGLRFVPVGTADKQVNSSMTARAAVIRGVCFRVRLVIMCAALAMFLGDLAIEWPQANLAFAQTNSEKGPGSLGQDPLSKHRGELRGQILELIAHYETMISQLRAAVSNNPDDAPTRVLLGNAQRKRDDLRRMLTAIDQD